MAAGLPYGVTTKSAVGGAAPGSIGKLYPKKPSECALEGEVCMRSDIVTQLVGYLQKQHPEVLQRLGTKVRKDAVVRAITRALRLTSESQIWQHPEIREHFGGDVADRYLQTLYKPTGPSDSDALISSLDIDAIMQQWTHNSQALFKRKFMGLPYQMDDFLQQKTELAKLDIPDLMKQGYGSFAVILNTDSSSGNGEHWYCVYGDLAHKGTESDPIVLEYFNSSGNPLGGTKYQNINLWLSNEKVRLLRDYQIHARINVSVPRRLQYSNTECGVWSLCYIHSRLSGNPTNYFDRNEISDKEMYEYRKHLFRPGDREVSVSRSASRHTKKD